MYQITKPSDVIQLIRWNKELPSASAADPLGLNLRVSARLANELLHCITSITPRARYYSFFPWAFEDYRESEQGTSKDRGRVPGVLARERAMVLGAVLHHDGRACEGGALGGSDPASTLAKSKRKSYDLLAWRHLKAAEGQFGAAYKGSLINLGIFKTESDEVEEDATVDTDELDESVQAIEVAELSSLGKRLAHAFSQSVRRTKYVTEGWAQKKFVDSDVLKQFGSRAGLCEIEGKAVFDRDVLRCMFFALDGFRATGSHRRRRMSLLLVLECIGRAQALDVSFDNAIFSDICYFGEILVGEETPEPIAVTFPKELNDIAERWRAYHSHSYLAVALQSFLVALGRILRDRPGGIARIDLLNQFSSPAISARFTELFGHNLPGEFFDLTPRDMLAFAGVALLKSGQGAGDIKLALPIISPFSERNLEEHLIGGEANDSAGIAIAAMLFYQTLLRYPAAVAGPFHNWYTRHVKDPYADIALPGVLDMLHGEFGGSWIDRSNREVLDRVIWRFVVRQHQTMSYERGFGGNAPLFHVDGVTVIGTNTDYTDPRALNVRLRSALQILTDLGLVSWDDESGYSRTDDGDAWLAAELLSEQGP
ncbi:hypothetical protein IC762_30830 [Bradyrhizobium genosp. L]|uniref:hypothetical protein n=1 Tax=Bradyrhizobium genosp. L TaxID=83637 RepID=UPI0018A25424|nr:hypothetical protein [Bradyrhizobium genosp. L]QPF83989.1 hypothetical protein IC762_30830 [Bradyrhizobium genosp. L]